MTADQRLHALAHAERASLADDLATLSGEQWSHPTLCVDWDVQDVVAHLVAAASLGRWQWLRSMAGAGFRPAVHNQRRLAERRGTTPAETLAAFRAIIGSTTAPSGHTAAYLGEVVVHSADIRRPLGIPTEPAVEALTPVAKFFAARDFAVGSRTLSRGLRLVADDGPFAAGDGPRASGPTLALVMVMAGRGAFLDQLDGEGVATLRERLPA